MAVRWNPWWLEKRTIFEKGIKGKKDDPWNYPPLSLTSVPGKIMEQILMEVKLKHIEYRWLEKIKGKFCLMNLVTFNYGETASVDKGKETGVIYLDLCKAFDTILHNIFVAKLERDGFDGWIIQ